MHNPLHLRDLLFSLYVKNIPTDKNCHTSQFAGDIAIWCKNDCRKSEEKFQILLMKIKTWYKTWKIGLNYIKTTSICLKTKTTKKSTIFTINDHKIILQELIKFLGIIFDKNLNFHTHIVKSHKYSEVLNYQTNKT